MRGMLAVIWMIVMMGVGTAAGGGQPRAVEYLSALPECLAFHQQAWGQLGINVAAHAPGQEPMKLRIKDKEYTNGLGSHAPGEIIIDLDGHYETFQAEVGVQWQEQNVGSVVFQVFVDDEKRFDSGVMKESDSAKPVKVSLLGARELRLVITDAGDGITCDCANWAEARLVRVANPKAVKQPEPFDVAPFARVVTWDPSRMDGARASRIQEFHDEDLFLESDVLPNANGSFTVPFVKDGSGCIGLQWLERRRVGELGIELLEGTHRHSTDGVEVQGWVGESAWQGKWLPLKGEIERRDKRWMFRVEYARNPEIRLGVRKVRWVFPKTAQPMVARRLWANSLSRFDTAKIRIDLEKPLPGETGEVELYNGAVADAGGYSVRQKWDLKDRLQLDVRYARPRPWMSDRTVIRVKLPTGSFGVAVDDILANGCVYVRDPGVYVCQEPAKARLYDYLGSIAGKETILERVRKLPDQTMEQAMARTRNPIQSNGPTMLSLACDNHKFVVQREGAIEFSTRPDNAEQMPLYPLRYPGQLAPSFGSGQAKFVERHLDGGWLPIPVTTFQEGSVTYRQRTCVAPLGKGAVEGAPEWPNSKPLCIAEFGISNDGSEDADAKLEIAFLADAEKSQAAEVMESPGGVVVLSGDRLLAVVELPENGPLACKVGEGRAAISGRLPAGATAQCWVYIPGWETKLEDQNQLKDARQRMAGVEAYWKRVLSEGADIQVPDQFLTNVIRASQVHCLMAARNERQGALVAPWIASMVYGPLESEANSIVRGMLLMGHEDFARRCLEFFISRYSKEGFLTTGYTLMGTGWHLQSLGEYFALTQNTDWMERFAPEVDRVCRWIVRQREKTKKLDARGEKVPEYGLMPPGVQADWNAFAYYFSLNGYYYSGLAGAGAALAAIDHPDASKLLASADEFREDILRAYKWTQSRMPVVPLKDGTWVPGYPSQVHVPGPTNNFFPGEDGNRSWAYDVELGAHQIVPQGVLEPNSRETMWMMDHMEDIHFLSDGWFDYPGEKSQKDWFNLGGFAKVQPYYCRNAEICALRDDVKPFVRSYFNALASLINTENLSFWEHFHASGAWNKTHETGYFLQQTHFMLAMEHGEGLRLAPFVTSNWMKEGMVVSATGLPTRFGDVSYRITSHVGEGYIEAEIDPPTRSAPAEIVIRLRHPEGKHIRSVTINGKPHTEFDPTNECVHLKPGDGKMVVRAEY